MRSTRRQRRISHEPNPLRPYAVARPAYASASRSSSALFFRLRYRYRRTLSVAAGLAAVLVIQSANLVNVFDRSDEPASHAAPDEPNSRALSTSAVPIEPDRESNKGAHSIDSDERIIVVSHPGGLELAQVGLRVEVVAIGGMGDAMEATPVAGAALVVARSDATASLVVTQAQSQRILELQAFGAIAFLGIDQ